MASSWASWVKAQGVASFGEGKYPICMNTAAQNDTAIAFTTDDFIGELNDISGMGAQRETSEINGYRYDSAAKITGKSTPNDVTLTLNLVKTDVDLLRGYYKSNQLLGVGIFVKGPSYNLIYGFNGTISQWGMETPNGETASLTITMAVVNDEAAHTFSAS
jgi:hypothetical protein